VLAALYTIRSNKDTLALPQICGVGNGGLKINPANFLNDSNLIKVKVNRRDITKRD